MSVVKYLEQHIEDVRMRFLDLIKKDDGERFSAYCLRELSAFIVAYVSWRCSDQSGDGELLHILAHVDPDHVIFIIEEACRQCSRQLRLTDTGRSEEQEGTDRTLGILDTGLGPKDRIRDLLYSFILSDDALMELCVKMKDFFPLTLCQFCDRNPRPLGDDPTDFVVGDLLMYHGEVLSLDPRFRLLQSLLDLRQLAVLQLGSLFKIVIPLRDLDLRVQLIDLLAVFLEAFDVLLFIFPLSLLDVEGILLLGKILLQGCKSLTAQRVALLFERCLLDLHLHDLSLHLVKLCRQ